MNDEQNSGVSMPPEQNVPTTPQITPPAPQNISPNHNASKLPFISIVVVIILCLTGGSVFAYYRFFVPTISPIDILKNSVQASLKVRSFSFAATSTGKVENNKVSGVPTPSDFTVTSNGSIDYHTLDSLLLEFNLGVNASANTATSTGSLNIGTDSIYANHNFYVNLKNFNLSYSSTDSKTASAQIFVALVNGFASSLLNKWIQIDTSNTIKTPSSQSTMSEEDKALVRDYITGMSYITAISNVGDETIGSTPTYHLKVTIQNGQKLNDIIRKISLERNAATAYDMDTFNKSMGDISKTIDQKVDFDIWIGKHDSLVYKIVSTPVTISIEQSGTKTTSSGETTFSNYDVPSSITAPQGAVPIEQVMQSLFGSMYVSASMATTSSKTTPIKRY